MIDESNYVVLSDLEEGEIPDFEIDEKYPQNGHNTHRELNNIEKTLYNEDELKEALSTYYSVSHLHHSKKNPNSICYGPTIKCSSSERSRKGIAKLEVASFKKRQSDDSKFGKGYNKYSSQVKSTNIKKNQLRKPCIDSCLDFFHKQRIKALSKAVVSHSKDKIDLSSHSSMYDKTSKVALINKNSPPNKQNGEAPKKSNDYDNTIKLKEVIPPVNAVPGSLGEMLLQMQLEGKLKGNPAKTLHGISDSKNKKFCSESNDEEEDELTLRYIALQSAVKSLITENDKADDYAYQSVANSRSNNLSQSEHLKTTIVSSPKNNDENMESSSLSVPCLVKVSKNNSNTFYKPISCAKSIENSAIDMEISSDSSTEMSDYILKGKPEPTIGTGLSFSTAISENKLENVNSNFTNLSHSSLHIIPKSFENEPLDHLENENSQSFPVEWAYMIPPPPQPDQPANDLNIINNWVYNQNMCIQNQTMLDSSSNFHSLQHITDLALSQPFHDAVNDNEIAPSLHNKFTNPVHFDYKTEEINLSVESVCDLRDTHEKQYRSFMSSILQHQNSQVKSENEDQKNAKRLNKSIIPTIRTLTVIPIDKGKNHSSSKSYIGKKRSRRRRKSFKGTGIRMNNDKGVMSKNISLMSDYKDKKLGCIDEDDEDLLRAQLLKSMSINNGEKSLQSIAETTFPLQIARKQKTFSSNSVNDKKFKKFGYLNNVSAKRPTVSQSVTKLQVKGREVLKRKIQVSKKNASALDIGGKYLGTKAPFSEPSFSNKSEIPHFKFPTIKPVIITLNDDSDTTDEDFGHNPRNLTLDAKDKEPKYNREVASSIDNLLKSIRNCNSIDEYELKKNETKDAVKKCPTNVGFLSETKQEEYKKLKQLLSRKKQQLQVKADPKRIPKLHSVKEKLLPCLQSDKVIKTLKINNEKDAETKDILDIGCQDSNPLLENRIKLTNKEICDDNTTNVVVTQDYVSNISTATAKKNSFIVNNVSSETIPCQEQASKNDSNPNSDKLLQSRINEGDTDISDGQSEHDFPLSKNYSSLKIGQFANDNVLFNQCENLKKDITLDQSSIAINNKILNEDYVSSNSEKIQKCVSTLYQMKHPSVVVSSNVHDDSLTSLKSNSSSNTSEDDSTSSSSSSSTSSESSDEESSDSGSHNLKEEFLRKKLLSKRQSLIQQKITTDVKNKDNPSLKQCDMSFEFSQCEKSLDGFIYNDEKELKSYSEIKSYRDCAAAAVIEDDMNLKKGLVKSNVATHKLKNYLNKDENPITSIATNKVIPEKNAKCNEINQVDQETKELQNMFEIDTIGNADNILFLNENVTNFAKNDKEFVANNGTIFIPSSKSCELSHCSGDIPFVSEIKAENLSTSILVDSSLSILAANHSLSVKEDKKLDSPISPYFNTGSKLKSLNYDKSSVKPILSNVSSNLHCNGNKNKMYKKKHSFGKKSIDPLICHNSAIENVNRYDQKLELLKRIREESVKKCISIKELNQQISGLIKEATDDVACRQSILHQISKLYIQLEKFHSEEKIKALAIQKKIQKLLKLQQKLDEDNKSLGELQHLGKEVACSKSYNNEDRNIIFKKIELERRQLMSKIDFLKQSIRSREESSGNLVEMGNKLCRPEKQFSSTDVTQGADFSEDFHKVFADPLCIKENPKNESISNFNDLGVLCPYDLLGRCNDDHCTLKHTSSSCHESISSDINISKDVKECVDSNAVEKVSLLVLGSECLHKSFSEAQLTVNDIENSNDNLSILRKPLVSYINHNSSDILNSNSTLILKNRKKFLQRLNKSSSITITPEISVADELLNDYKIGNEYVLLQRVNYIENHSTLNAVSCSCADVDASLISKASPKCKKRKVIEQDMSVLGNKHSKIIRPCIINSKLTKFCDNSKDAVYNHSQFMDNTIKDLMPVDICNISLINSQLQKESDNLISCLTTTLDANVELSSSVEIHNNKGISKDNVDKDNNCKSLTIDRSRQSKKNKSAKLGLTEKKRFCKLQKDDAGFKELFFSLNETVSNSLLSQKNLQKDHLTSKLPDNVTRLPKRKRQAPNQKHLNASNLLGSRQSIRLRKKK